MNNNKTQIIKKELNADASHPAHTATLTDWQTWLMGKFSVSRSKAREFAEDYRTVANDIYDHSLPTSPVKIAVENSIIGKLALDKAQADNPRYSAWDGHKACVSSVVIGSLNESKDWDYYAKSCKYPKLFRYACYTSLLVIDPTGTATYTRHTKSGIRTKKVTAPAGFRWCRDGALIRKRDEMDFHPSGLDLELSPRELGRKVHGEMDANKARRKESAKLAREIAKKQTEDKRAKAKARAVEAKALKLSLAHQIASIRGIIKANPGLVVGVEDSKSAGNCEAGTLAFISKHHLPTPCPAKLLLKFVKGANLSEAKQVRAAILQAFKRASI